MMPIPIRLSLFSLLALAVVALTIPNRVFAGDPPQKLATATVQVTIPDEDRFTPFAMTINVGTTVTWVNNDTDDHTLVSDDAFNTAGHFGTNIVIKANGGKISLTFRHPGVFPYYCRFHAMLDGHHQPIAPGPDGGIQNPDGNYGTPMNGVITVVGD
ncbi:MAG: cupredoxin domain-containing protein [Candidatus Sulfotelmatobacter sp.]